MKNPTKKQVQRVLDNFEKVLPAALKLDKKGGSLNMYEGSILSAKIKNSNYSCGTPLCHGGWYAITSKKIIKELNKYNIYTGPNFRDGAFLMAEHLGFNDEEELEDWANENPYFWGNNEGSKMFCSNDAFITKKGFPRTLKDIINFWKAVQKRLPK